MLFSCVSEIPVDEIPMKPWESLIVVEMIKFCCHTHCVTLLGLNPTTNPSPTLSGCVTSFWLNDHD